MSKLDLPNITNRKIYFKDEIETNILEDLKKYNGTAKIKEFVSNLNNLNNDEFVKLLSQYFDDNTKVDGLVELLKCDLVSSKDIVNIGYRKKQLKIFEQLLAKDTPEEDWQNFFENNQWVFGYGLNYVFNSPLAGEKMEQSTKGSDLTGSGKIPDAFLASYGAISSVCLVEIKTNKTPLLKGSAAAYRKDCWQVSNELIGAISQSQKTLHKTNDTLKNKYEHTSKNGNPTGETVYLYQPKSYLLIGNLSEFRAEHGVNAEKFSSFQLFRRNIHNPEIITFDELYERARHIIEHNEMSSQS